MGPIRLLCTLVVACLTLSPLTFAFQSDAGRQDPEDSATFLAKSDVARSVPRVIRFSGGVRTAGGDARTEIGRAHV